jgi:cyclopropane-fatty-acyl-phospholipid synthase
MGEGVNASAPFALLLEAAELGRLPDAAIRLGIRRLLRQRLRDWEQMSCEGHQEAFRRFLADCRNGPVAPLPGKANEQHYEVPVALFERALGRRLKYSCCYWPEGVTDLDSAEEEALRITCDRAGLADGMEILELGCGWGSLSLWMGEQYPQARILAVSNSASQRRFIESRIAALGLSNLTVCTCDMNDFHSARQFDAVVSVEMFEHMRNHAELLRRVAGWLRPGGRLFVHMFCHRQQAYEFTGEGPQDWMARYFFTGGIMPNQALLLNHQQDLRVLDQWCWNGQHYARTCDAWLARFDRHRDVLLRTFEETWGPRDARVWLQRWRMFFMACSELFACRNGNEWFVTHVRMERP